MIINFFRRLFGLFKTDSRSKSNPNNYSFRNQPDPNVAKTLESGETLYYDDGDVDSPQKPTVDSKPKRKTTRKSTKAKTTRKPTKSKS